MIDRVLIYLQLERKCIEFEVADETYQVAGQRGLVGCWQRHFHQGDHPTRSRVGNPEAERLLGQAAEVCLYRLRKDEDGAETLPLATFLARVQAHFSGTPATA